MPTFAIEVREKNERRDGKFPVSIRFIHKRVCVNIKTGVYVTRKQIKPDFSGLKDNTIIKGLLNDISNYEDILTKGLGTDLSKYTAQELVEYINYYRSTSGGAGIDFVSFVNNYISKLELAGRGGYAEPFRAVIRNLIDYFDRDIIYIKEINVKNLQGFVDYMQKPRILTRINQFGKEVTTKRSGVRAQTIKDYLGDIRTLFNAACEEYNDDDSEIQLITHRPFSSKKLQIEVREEPEKRDLSVDDLVKILKTDNLPGLRMQLARDVLALSFYLLAMNTADLYGADATLNCRRIVYHRQKTATRRKDEALLSVKIEPEVLPLIRKYRDPLKKRLFKFYTLYSDFKSFNKNVNAGCRQLAKYLGIDVDLTTYYIRHTWATIASEDCGISDSDIAIALNHVSDSNDILGAKSLKVTRGYIHRRFVKNDVNNRAILDYVKSKY